MKRTTELPMVVFTPAVPPRPNGLHDDPEVTSEAPLSPACTTEGFATDYPFKKDWTAEKDGFSVTPSISTSPQSPPGAS